MDWFLCDNGLCHEKVKEIGVFYMYEISIFNILCLMFSQKFIFFKTKK